MVSQHHDDKSQRRDTPPGKGLTDSVNGYSHKKIQTEVGIYPT